MRKHPLIGFFVLAYLLTWWIYPVLKISPLLGIFGLFGPAAVHGQLFVLYSQPDFGFSRFGDSSMECASPHSVAGSLPSTGAVQLNFGLRFGMKFAWKYAMLPSASAKMVLFEEFVWSSIEFLNSL